MSFSSFAIDPPTIYERSRLRFLGFHTTNHQVHNGPSYRNCTFLLSLFLHVSQTMEGMESSIGSNGVLEELRNDESPHTTSHVDSESNISSKSSESSRPGTSPEYSPSLNHHDGRSYHDEPIAIVGMGMVFPLCQQRFPIHNISKTMLKHTHRMSFTWRRNIS